MEHVTDVTKGFEQGIKGSGTDAPQVGFEFGERHFDGVQIRAVGGQEQEPAASLTHGLRCARAFVRRQVVEDHNRSRFKHRGQLRLDVRVECRPVHGPFDDPGRDQGVLRKPGNERLSAPLAKGCRTIEPFPDRGTSAEPREVGLDRRLVNEDQPVRLLAHAGLTAGGPIETGLAQRGPVTLGCDQSFFYMIIPRVRGHDATRRVVPPRHVSRRGQQPTP